MNQRTFEKLKEIQARMPEDLKRAYSEKEAYDQVKLVINKAIEDPNTPPERRDEFETFLKTGQLDRKVYESDPELEAQANEWLTREIKEAIRKGELEHPNKDPLFRKIRSKRKRR